MFNETITFFQTLNTVTTAASTETMSLSEYMSYVFGALYLSLWSLSFYPQLWENYKRNHTLGLSYDYAMLQTTAYFLFCLYSYSGKIELIGHKNAEGMGLNFEPIDRADVAFATHAFLLSAALFTQTQVMHRGHIGDQKTFKKWVLKLLYAVCGFVLLSFAVELSIDERNHGKNQSAKVILPLSVQTQMICGYGLVCLHIGKYVPQFLRNQNRRSTVGLSVQMVTFDLLGSGFSLMQILMDSVYLGKKQQNRAFNNLNLIKLFVATTSVVFDFIFIMQHCLLYREAVEVDNKRKQMYENREDIQEVGKLIDQKLKRMQVIPPSIQSSIDFRNGQNGKLLGNLDALPDGVATQQQQFNYPMNQYNNQGYQQDQDQSQIEMLDVSSRDFFGLNRGGGLSPRQPPQIMNQQHFNNEVYNENDQQYYQQLQQYYNPKYNYQ